MHIKRSTYEAYLRQEMILRKMSAVVAQSLWVAPSEIEKSVAQLTDVFTIDVVDISYSNSVDNIKASEDDVKKYYDEHKGQFEIPEMRCVKYVDWPISNFLAKASVSELEIKVYYEDNIDDFARTDTTNSTEAYKPLEEVSGTISNKLAHEQAIDLAGEDAMLFTDDLSKKDYDNKITIEQIADKRKCTVHTSEYFSATGEVPGLNVSKSFVKSAFDLKKDVPEDSYSEAIIEKNAVYVMAIAAIKPPSIPPFKEIKEDVRKYADSLAKSEAFNKKVEDIRKKIKAAVATGTDISKLAKKLDLKIRSPKPFSIYDSMNDDDLSDIGPALLGLNKGEVSDPAPTATGAAIIYVKDRQPGDFALAESLKPEIARTIQSNRMQAHFVTWAKSVLKEARGEDESTTAADEGAEEDKDEANNS
jgi:peptidyl-prolyl cis-trans isomerase D